jgi:hypothetical protein
LTDKTIEAIKVDDISLTKYSAIILKENIYFEIFWDCNNQLGLDLAIVVMANMADELDMAKGYVRGSLSWLSASTMMQ